MPFCQRCGRQTEHSGPCDACLQSQRMEFSPAAVPEYLPPEPVARGRVRRSAQFGIAQCPATLALLLVNVGVYVAMVVSGVSPVRPTPYELVHWGANVGTFVLMGQWWRLITAAFVHIGILHIATNMWCLWNLGLLGEPLLGRFGLTAVYLLTGISGNLLTVYLRPGLPQHGGVEAGASGAIFGICGALIAIFKFARLPIPQAELRQLTSSVVGFAVLNLVIGFAAPGISNSAHIGGLFCGFLMGLFMAARMMVSPAAYARRQWTVVVGTALVLAAACYEAERLYGPALRQYLQQNG